MLNYNSYIREQYQSLQEKVWKPNMGDLAEPILACGVAAKFANPDAVVTRTAIEKLLRKGWLMEKIKQKLLGIYPGK